ncbi:MAG: protein-disulfide reductase DsbD N-terminal domain-containing protein [Burkholderiales bacterium]
MLLAAVAPAWGVNDADLLPPEQAFRFSALALDANTIEVRYAVAPGYYLYRGKFRFALEPGALGAAVLPPGLPGRDSFFGEIETYRGRLRIRLPFTVPAGVTRVELRVLSQGCADVGVCYPPYEHRVALRVRRVRA